jgi:16S rRNA (guanine1207-N2)-methyltransferase
MKDPALDCLFYPFECGALALPDENVRGLFLNAAPSPSLDKLPGHWSGMQDYYPQYRDLKDRRIERISAGNLGKDYDLLFLRAPKQMQELRYMLALGLGCLKAEGTILAAAGNDAGGSRLPDLFKKAGLSPVSESKYKSRAVFARKPGITAAQDCLEQWLAKGILQPVMDGAYISRPGLFSWDRIDPGSAMLAEALPDVLSGRGADFGCGYGYLSREILRRGQGIQSLLCCDADARALEACKMNTQDFTGSVETEFLWHDLAAPDSDKLENLDWIVMNPPFHTGKALALKTGQNFIASAARALRKSGRLYMVSNAHLPYEQIMQANFTSVKKRREDHGYKIHECIK